MPSRPFVPLLALLVLCLHGGRVLADDYARSVDAAAEMIDQLGQNPLAKSREKDEHASRSEFETYLRKRYPGSYVFYTKLTEADKAEAVVEFNTSHSIEQTRKLIMERFLKR